MPEAKSGEAVSIGYLFTDIDGYTEKWERTPREMAAAQARHDAIIDEVIVRHGGVIHDRAGDGVFATFPGGDVLECALQLQLALQNCDWEEVDGLAVRIGVHCATPSDNGLSDKGNVIRASRIMSSAWGGQIVVSSAAVGACKLPDNCELSDLGLCRLKGIEQPMRLFGLLHPSLAQQEFPPLRFLSHVTQAILSASTPIYGREDELAFLISKFSGETRQVLIAGPGGNGKTRLAAEAGATFAEQCPVHFVDLEQARSSADLVAALAHALRLPLHARAEPDRQLLDYLRDRPAFLVLDNADALSDENDVLLRMRRQSAQLRLLITRREPFGAPGETVLRLGGLAAPAHAGEMTSAPACALFVQAARSLDRAFELAPSDFESFSEICSLIGGSPLALHLTAQWTGVLSLPEIAERLRGGISFLADIGETGSGRGLGDVFAVSWRLLSAEQQSNLAKLSIFQSGFDVEAAHTVVGVTHAELGVLERKCLIERRERRRFMMHPLVHDYARVRLRDAPLDVLEETQRRHSVYFLNKLCRHYGAARGAVQGQELDLALSEFANIRAAWFHAVENGDEARIRSTIEPLFNTLVLRGFFRECAVIFGAPVADPTLQRYFLAILANCSMHQGDYDAGENAAQRALDGPQHGAILGHCHQALGNIAHARGRFAIARVHYERAMSERVGLGDLMGSHNTGMSLAWLHLQLDEPDQAREWVKECFRLCQRLGHSGGMLAVHACSGDIAVRYNKPEDAEASYRAALKVEEKVHYPQHRAATLIKLSGVHAAAGQFDEAGECLREAEEIALQIGDRRIGVNAAIALARSLRLQGSIETSRACLHRALAVAHEINASPQIGAALLELVRVERADARPAQAIRVVRAAWKLDLPNLAGECAALAEDLGVVLDDQSGEPVEEVVLELINESVFGQLRV